MTGTKFFLCVDEYARGHINPIYLNKISERKNLKFCTNLVVFKVLYYLMYQIAGWQCRADIKPQKMSSHVPRIFRFTQLCTLRGPRYAVDKILHCSYYPRSIYLKTLFKWMILSPFRWCCYCPPLIQLHFVADSNGGWSFDVYSLILNQNHFQICLITHTSHIKK